VTILARPRVAIMVAVGVVCTLAGAAMTIGWLTGQHQPPAKVAQDKMVMAVPATTSGAAPAVPTRVDLTPSVLYASSFVGLDGKTVSLGQWQNQLLVLNFWATWCGPCKEEMPIFDRIQSRLDAKGVQIVGIAADSQAKVANFKKQLPVSYPLLPDEAGAIELSKRLGNRLGLLPHTVVIAPGGEIVYAKLGVVNEAEFESLLIKNIK
jgi:thiol-disulfide isomerase/thioredoxin